MKKEKRLYSINFENEYSKKILEITIKQFKQLKELPLEVYLTLIDLTEYFSEHKDTKIILFGSYSKLTYSIKSDIDIAVIYKKIPDKKRINRLLEKIEKKYHKKIEVHYFEKNKFKKNKKDPLIKSIIKDGTKIL